MEQVLEVPGTWVPLVNLRGMYVLPGVPRLFRSMLEAHVDRFSGPAHRQAELLTNQGEGDLAGPPPLTYVLSTVRFSCPARMHRVYLTNQVTMPWPDYKGRADMEAGYG